MGPGGQPYAYLKFTPDLSLGTLPSAPLQPGPAPGVLFLQVLYLLGAMLLSMALQLDRHGLWNLLGPSLFALGILATAWVRLGGLG